MKTRQMGALLPSAMLSRKGIARYGGGVSRTGPLSPRVVGWVPLWGVERTFESDQRSAFQMCETLLAAEHDALAFLEDRNLLK